MKFKLRTFYKFSQASGWTDEPFFIDWSHHPQDGVTFCHLFREKDGKREGIDWGASLLNPKDVYCREVGRKVSLERLMEHMKLSREERARIWKEYAVQTNKPWVSQFLTPKPTLSPARSAGL